MAGKKQAVHKAEPPRVMNEIQTAYNELRLKVADAQYQVFVYENAVADLNVQMMKLNQEAAARGDLDRKTAAEAATQTPQAQVQS